MLSWANLLPCGLVHLVTLISLFSITKYIRILAIIIHSSTMHNVIEFQERKSEVAMKKAQDI